MPCRRKSKSRIQTRIRAAWERLLLLRRSLGEGGSRWQVGISERREWRMDDGKTSVLLSSILHPTNWSAEHRSASCARAEQCSALPGYFPRFFPRAEEAVLVLADAPFPALDFVLVSLVPDVVFAPL